MPELLAVSLAPLPPSLVLLCSVGFCVVCCLLVLLLLWCACLFARLSVLLTASFGGGWQGGEWLASGVWFLLLLGVPGGAERLGMAESSFLSSHSVDSRCM